MKIKIDAPTLKVLATVTQYGLKQSFEDRIFETFFRTSLQSLILKLMRANMRIRRALTLQLTPAEVICYKWSLEFYNKDKPGSYEYTISNQFFLAPVLKKLN